MAAGKCGRVHASGPRRLMQSCLSKAFAEGDFEDVQGFVDGA